MSTACHVLLRTDGKPIPNSAPGQELRLFSKCRNEKLRLPAFLKHYRKLGVQRFFMVDNASDDGSAEFLKAQPDVHVFNTDGSFRAARGGTDWLNAVLQEFGVGHWCVTVDVDELLRYPGSETVDLHRLVRHLDEQGYEAMHCLLLDMYPERSLREATEIGDDLVAAAPYFDAGPYRRFPCEDCPGVLIYGGVRERVFYPEARADDLARKLHVRLYHRLLFNIPVVRDSQRLRAHRPHFPPCLTKVPLVRWAADTRYLNVNHFVSPRKLAPEAGALLHFKLLGDFHQRADQEVARKEYYDGAVEFRRYSAKLRANREMTFRYADSVRLESDSQLVELGLMSDSVAWRRARGSSVDAGHTDA
jgi:hypothetical protein